MQDENFHQNRARKRLIIFAVVIAIAVGVGWYLVHTDSFEKISALEVSAQHFAATKIDTTFSAPPPLIATSSPAASNGNSAPSSADTTNAAANNTLTHAGVIADTNDQRALNGNLPPLAEDATLDDIASLRLDDMFAKQYFAHVSPSSSSAETVAQAVGYDYIALGENLALGYFGNDAGVVTAWMNSPGHRANILNTHYTQIGVAVGEGEFQGEKTWIAVQVFGRPASDCVEPDAALEAQINTEQSQLAQTEAQLQTLQAQINAANPKSGDAYDQQVSDYNSLVQQYDTLLAQTKSQIAQYNTQVEVYNACIGS